MPEIVEKTAKQSLTKALREKAVLLWGSKRAQEADETIVEVADYIWAIAQNPVPITEPLPGYPTLD